MWFSDSVEAWSSNLEPVFFLNLQNSSRKLGSAGWKCAFRALGISASCAGRQESPSVLRSESVRLGHNKSAIFGALKHGCNPAPVHKKTQESDLCKKAGRDKFSSRASLLLPILPLVPNKEILTANEEIPTANEKKQGPTRKTRWPTRKTQKQENANRKTPTANTEKPKANTEKPKANAEKPKANNPKPFLS